MLECKVERLEYGGKRVTWYRDGIKENIADKPAEIIIYSIGVRKYWYRNGKLHREADKPSDIFYIKEDNVWYKRAERWLKNGILHRDNDEPATITYYINGNINNESWYLNGEKSRITLDKPSEIEYNTNGSKKYEKYTDTNGRVYRENGPSIVNYDPDGTKVREVYFIDRMLHRLDGSAEIEYTNNRIINCSYYLFGISLTHVGYIRILYIIRRYIWRYRIKQRRKLLDYLRTTKFYENKSDICKMITTYVY
jgi:hypothetical protein